MKKIVFALSLIVLSQSASAAYSCSELQAKQSVYASELAYLREKISAARNSDVIELYMSQYEAAYASYQGLAKAIDDQCK